MPVKRPVFALATYTSVVTVGNGHVEPGHEWYYPRDAIGGMTDDGRLVYIAVPRKKGESESAALRRMITKLTEVADAREETERRNALIQSARCSRGQQL